MRKMTVCLAFLCALFQILPCAAAPRYRVTDLGNTRPSDVNSLGQVTGYTNDEVSHAFIWQRGMMTDLGTLPNGDWSEGYAINDAGHIVGDSQTVHSTEYGDIGTFHAFFWRPGARMVDIDSNTHDYSVAEDINNKDQVVGSTHIAGSWSSAWIWREGQRTDLGLGHPHAINNLGHVVGFSDTFWDGCLWRNGQTIPLEGNPWDINDRGWIVGSGDSYPYTAAMWVDGVRKQINTPANSTWSEAYAINSSGQIVGAVGTMEDLDHAFLWSVYGESVDLNDLVPRAPGWILLEARGINDAGQIVASGLDPGYSWHGFLLTPIIDVQPGEYPNTVNLHSNGVVKVAITTTRDFDATKVDPGQVWFAGAKPTHWNRLDYDRDGDTDMVFHFHARKLNLRATDIEATLSGRTYQGVKVEGSDSIRVAGTSRR